MGIADLRQEYMFEPLDESAVNKDPFLQFSAWFAQAESLGIPEPNAMVLATATREGRPSSRTVLLKGFDQRGFVFYTNYDSKKSRDLLENPYASLTFLWQPLAHQVRIDGRVEKTSREESEAYFKSRPLGNRLGAIVSPQSEVIPSRQFLEQKLKKLSDKYLEDLPPLPEFWGGFRVVPTLFEFWQGRPNRLHDRIQYTRGAKDEWIIRRLAP